ncbi:hypothetical protein MP638_004670 [Amoeboaphelidium occidentale]|nr:hypothetical protein MP638_004670 [Amoeboaphelidium occidentale]
MSTKNEQGQYLLTLDHPQLFKLALKCLLPKDRTWENYSKLTKALGMNIGNSMRALASTLNYLGIPLPDKVANFQNEADAFQSDIGRLITDNAENQICEVAIEYHQEMIQAHDTFLDQSLHVALKFNFKLCSHEIIISYESFDRNIGFDRQLEYLDFYAGLEDVFCMCPLLLLAKKDNELFLELLRKHLVSIIVSTFCILTDTSVESQKVETIQRNSDGIFCEITVHLKLKLAAESSDNSDQAEEMLNR